VRAALKAGATKDEILEALECSSVLGIHAATVGVPSILEAFREAGKLPAETPELDAAGQKAKEEFTKARGYWGSCLLLPRGAELTLGQHRFGPTSSRWTWTSSRPTRSSPPSRGIAARLSRK
jgi:hypothetical protein